MPDHRDVTLARYRETYADFNDWLRRDERYREHDLELDEFIQKSNWSRRQVQRTLAHFGTSFRDELTSLRMANAARQIAESKKTVSAIAFSVGYKQPAQFAKAFRRQYGLTPSQHRAKSRQRIAA